MSKNESAVYTIQKEKVKREYCDLSREDLFSVFKKIAEPYTIICWLYDMLLIGSDISHVSPQKILRMRIYNENEEVHLWKTQSKFKARVLKVQENDGEEQEYVQAKQLLWGKAELKDNVIILKEDRGVYIQLPKDAVQGGVKTGERLFLVTKNYVGYNEIGQAGYVDSRFVKITGDLCGEN